MLSILFLLILKNSFADDSIPESNWTRDIQIKAIDYSELLSTSPNIQQQLNVADLKLIYEKKIHDDLKFKMNMNFIDYALNPFSPSPEEKTFFDVPELYFKLNTGPAILKIGTDIYSWGVTDGQNPVDIVNTKAYLDPIHPQKLGAASAAINYTWDWLEADLILTPQARSPVLPWTSSRWLPRDVYFSQSASQNIELLLPNSFNYNYDPQPSLSDALINNIALRMQAHLQELELALYFYDGVAPFPLITPVASGTIIAVSPITIVQVDSGVSLQTQDYRETMAGFSFVKTISDLQLKGVTAWTQPYPSATSVKNWSQESVFALEKNWNLSESTTFVSILQYSIARRSEGTSNDLSSFSQFFDNNWMLGGHLMWSDSDSFTFFYADDVLTNSSLYDLNWETHPNDSLKVGVSSTLLYGPINSPLGVFTKNKSISLYFNYIF